MEDPAEIAALAQELISSLDNLPQEVGHIVSEIEHKESKVQDLLPRIATRESQLRDVLTKGGTNLANPGAILPETERAKVDKLLEKIRSDFERVEELSRQKEALSLQLWRETHQHTLRLSKEMDRIAPHVLAAFGAQDSAPSMPVLTGLPSVLPGLKPGADGDAVLKRKSSAMLSGSGSPAVRTSSGTGTPKGWRQGTPSADLSGALSVRASSPTATSLKVPRKALKAGRPGSLLSTAPLYSFTGFGLDDEMDADGDMELDLAQEPAEPPLGGADADATLYCHCQRVSFGEMIGCDSDECKFEWFHIGCVGVSKPLPQTWFCDDCKERIASQGTQKKKKNRP